MKRFAALAAAALVFALALSCATAPAAAKAAPAETAAPATQAPAPEAPAAAVPAPAAEAPAAAAPAAPTAEPPKADPAAVAAALKDYAAASVPCMSALQRAETLAQEGQWLSAYRVMDDFDKANADPYALAMKTSLALRGNARSELLTSFGFADLAADQDLETLRGEAADYEMHPLDPPALAAALEAKGSAAPGILSRILAEYYVSAFSNYSGKWTIADEDIISKAAEQFAKAFAAGVFDSASLLTQAECLMRLDRGDDAEPVYLKAIELDPANGELLYSYATSLVARGKKAEALPVFDRAIVAYGEDSQVVNAIAYGARLSAELGDDAKMEGYFAQADEAFPDSPTPGLLRQMVLAQAGRKAAADAAADAVAAAYGSNPNVVRALVGTWFQAGDSASARAFLERNIASGSDDAAVGTLQFYLAVLIAQGQYSDADKAVALAALDGAEARFTKVYGEGSQALGAIANVREAFQPQPDAAAQPAAPDAASQPAAPAADSGSK